MAGAYAVYHGPEGLAAIAARVHRSATTLAGWLRAGGLEIVHEHFFDTLDGRRPRPGRRGGGRRRRAADQPAAGRRRHRGGRLRRDDVGRRPSAPSPMPSACPPDDAQLDDDGADALPADLRRRTPYLTHPVFSAHRSETAMLRYLRALSDKDLALDRTMIPLGSCTMKLNAATEMAAITWPEFANLHPFAPGRAGPRLRAADRRAVHGAGRGHRLRRGQRAAQRRLAGRVRRAAGDPRLPPLPRRRPARRLPDPELGARHQRRQRGHGRHARGRRRLRRGRQRRPRRPAGEGGEARRPAGRDHAHLPVDARRVRARRPGDLRRGARRGRPGLRRRREPQRDGRAGQAGALRLRRQPPQPAQDVLHPARRRRPGRRADRRPRAPRPVPAGAPAGRHRHARARPCPAPRGGRPGSCRSRGPTCG